MSLSSTAEIESARGFGASIAVLCALLGEVRTLRTRRLADLVEPGHIVVLLAGAAISAGAVITLLAAFVVPLAFFGLKRLFLDLL